MVVLNGANNNFLIQKKYYGSASEAFLRSEAALKIPVRKFLIFFKNFHCLWWPSMYLGGIWCRNFRFSPMAKNVQNAIFQILSFLAKKLQKKILQIFSILFTKYSEHSGHSNFPNSFRNDWFTDLLTFDSSSVTYFVNQSFKKIFEKFKCPECSEFFENYDENICRIFFLQFFWSKWQNVKNGIFHIFGHRGKTKVVTPNST